MQVNIHNLVKGCWNDTLQCVSAQVQIMKLCKVRKRVLRNGPIEQIVLQIEKFEARTLVKDVDATSKSVAIQSSLVQTRHGVERRRQVARKVIVCQSKVLELCKAEPVLQRARKMVVLKVQVLERLP